MHSIWENRHADKKGATWRSAVALQAWEKAMWFSSFMAQEESAWFNWAPAADRGEFGWWRQKCRLWGVTGKRVGGTGTLGKLKAKFSNIQEGLERSCNLPSCVIFSRNCSDEICKHFFFYGRFVSKPHLISQRSRLFLNARFQASAPLPSYSKGDCINQVQLFISPFFLSLWLPILEGWCRSGRLQAICILE